MVVLSVGILLLAVMLSFSQDNLMFFKNNVKASQVKAALRDMKNAADLVYSQGKEAKTRVYVTIPESTNLTISTLPEGTGLIQAVVYLSGKQQYYDVYTDANLTGSLPSKAGGYCLDVTYVGSVVNITRSSGSC